MPAPKKVGRAPLPDGTEENRSETHCSSSPSSCPPSTTRLIPSALYCCLHTHTTHVIPDIADVCSDDEQVHHEHCSVTSDLVSQWIIAEQHSPYMTPYADTALMQLFMLINMREHVTLVSFV